jgi:predicted XRE-type DNA-binding protein
MRGQWASASTRWIVPIAVNSFAGERNRLAENAVRDGRPEAAKIHAHWYSYPRLQKALDGYDDPLAEVDRALYDAKKSLGAGESLTLGKVEWRVKKANGYSGRSVERPRHDDLSGIDPKGEGDPVLFNRQLWHTATPQDEKGIPTPRGFVPLDDPDLPELPKFFEDPDAFADYECADRVVLLEQIIARTGLTQRELDVLLLKHQDLKQKEIARHLGITEGRVSQLLKAAERKIANVA